MNLFTEFGVFSSNVSPISNASASKRFLLNNEIKKKRYKVISIIMINTVKSMVFEYNYKVLQYLRHLVELGN